MAAIVTPQYGTDGRGLGGTRRKALQAAAIIVHGLVCFTCLLPVRFDVSAKHPRRAELGHLLPHFLGGLSRAFNLALQCHFCNNHPALKDRDWTGTPKAAYAICTEGKVLVTDEDLAVLDEAELAALAEESLASLEAQGLI